MQKQQRQKIKGANQLDRGLVLVHTGNGKGKWKTGEREFFKRFEEELTWETMGDGYG